MDNVDVLSPEQLLSKKKDDAMYCVQNRYYFLGGGVAFGILLFSTKRRVSHFLLSALTGGIADIYYGYHFSCKNLWDDYRLCKEQFDSQKILSGVNKDSLIDQSKVDAIMKEALSEDEKWDKFEEEDKK